MEVRPDEGDLVIRQGEAGDRFYLVVEGELDVMVDDRHIRVSGPGDGFGEIALLRETPRTATVRARSGVTLLALDRDAFLAAVVGLGHSRRVANAVADARIATGVPASLAAPSSGA